MVERVVNNILDAIGQTPMVKINRLNPNPQVNIFAKLEGFNPTGSIKDRIALRMIEDAEASGRLSRGQTIIEPTSGNTGIGLAMVGVIKGYDVVIVMSDAVSVERRKIIRSYGAKVILTPGADGTDGAIRLARRMVAENPDKYFMPDQFGNAANYQTHYERTALEIWQQTGGKVDYLVCALGTSGTIMGISKFMRALNPHVKVVCAQPVKGHYIQGLKNMEEAIVPAIYDPSRIDIQEMVESREAIEMARQIILQEGIFAGMSSGAALLAAVRVAAGLKEGNMVVVFPDRADKYLSTIMFDSYSNDA
ncbi:MAG: cysteine synthase family protein [Clostridiales bacterium]|nr:cysteine synthase family protein [Clostridiales bacterium]